jgi:hypothetical protein
VTLSGYSNSLIAELPREIISKGGKFKFAVEMSWFSCNGMVFVCVCVCVCARGVMCIVCGRLEAKRGH